jgi:hypothetical protein
LLYPRHKAVQDDFPLWNQQDPHVSLTRLYDWAVANAQQQIDWYEGKIKPKGRFSRTLLALAIIIGGMGALCPLIDTACSDYENAICSIPFLELGYILIALAGVIIVFDRTFGFSAGWMRFMETKMNLQQALNEFRFTWAKALAKQVPEYKKGEHQQEPISALCDFTSKVDMLLINETRAWVLEFRKNLTEVDQLVDKGKQ